MNIIPLILFSFLLFSCATKNESSNSSQVITEGTTYLSPNQLVEANMIIYKDKDFNPSIYVGRGLLKPGSVVPEHVHNHSDEILIFKEGAGELIINDRVHKIENNQFIFIPKGAKHSYSNRSKKAATFIQIYNPSGPEQKFLEWAKQ